MKFLFKPKKTQGHMAVSLQGDGICAASVRRHEQGMPEIEWISFIPNPAFSVPRAPLEEWAKNANAAAYTCSNLLAKDEYQLTLLDAPNTPPNEWKAAIRWRLREVLDFPVTDATVDVLPIPIQDTTLGHTPSLYAIAARNGLIRERQNLFEAARMQLTIIDIPEMAQRNIASLLETSERAVALLSWDAHGTLLTITYRGELYVTRRIEVSTLQLSQDDEEQRREVYERLTVELQRTLDHFERQFRSIVLSRLVLGPLDAFASDLQSYLAGGLYVPVEQLELDHLFDISNAPELKLTGTQQRYFLTLGAALRSLEATA